MPGISSSFNDNNENQNFTEQQHPRFVDSSSSPLSKSSWSTISKTTSSSSTSIDYFLHQNSTMMMNGDDEQQEERSPANLILDVGHLRDDEKDTFVIDADDDDDVEIVENNENENGDDFDTNDENARTMTNGENGGGDESTADPIDLKIRNVVCMFHTCAHIDLKLVTARLCHVVYDRSKGVVEKALRQPYAHVKIWSSGKVILAGCRSEPEALSASRRVARLLQKVMGTKVKFASYRVTNIMATCALPFGIKIDQIAREYTSQASYEPELNTGLIWRSVTPKSTVRIHTTGSIIVTGALSSEDIVQVLTDLYPILTQFSVQRSTSIAAAAVANNQSTPSSTTSSTSSADSTKRKKAHRNLHHNHAYGGETTF